MKASSVFFYIHSFIRGAPPEPVLRVKASAAMPQRAIVNLPNRTNTEQRLGR